MTAPPIALEPHDGRARWLADAIVAGGGQVVPLDQAEAMVWASADDPVGLGRALAERPDLRWVQLPWAGVEPYRGVFDQLRTWTCGKGVYAEPVAEMAVALLLAGLRGLGTYARRTEWDQTDADDLARNLRGASITVLGGGGIASTLLRLLEPFRADVTVVRRHPHAEPLAGATRTVGDEALPEALSAADGVVLALALVPDTRGIIDAAALARMPDHAWLVNVARGAHVVTDDLVDALEAGTIGGAALDVTDPEPLPAGHRLWSLPNAIVTPHVGNTRRMAVPLLSARITENVRRWAGGEPLVGVVDPVLGY